MLVIGICDGASLLRSISKAATLYYASDTVCLKYERNILIYLLELTQLFNLEETVHKINNKKINDCVKWKRDQQTRMKMSMLGVSLKLFITRS